ncbi:MAG: hypothetical protein AAGI01_11155, partial [Myxococcota bacterium]
MKQSDIRAEFVRAFAVSALLLFTVPVLGVLLAGYAEQSYDERFLAGAVEAVGSATEEAAQAKAFFEQNPPSVLCQAPPAGMEFLDEVCGDHDQFRWMRQASFFAIALGVLAWLVMFACFGLASAGDRERMRRSFLVGWQVVRG